MVFCGPQGSDFYPRSPCGERPQVFQRIAKPFRISIHALLAESDNPTQKREAKTNEFLSTLSLRRATMLAGLWVLSTLFLSTLSLRRATLTRNLRALITLYFYPRSPCGERPSIAGRITSNGTFLSTLSLRRATSTHQRNPSKLAFLSTLSLRRATKSNKLAGLKLVFLSTLSLRRATRPC